MAQHCTRQRVRGDNARPFHSRIIEEYKTQLNTACRPLSSVLPDLNSIENLWDELGRENGRIKPWRILPDSTGQDNTSTCKTRGINVFKRRRVVI